MSHFQFMAPSDGTCHHWHRRKRDAWLCVTHWSSWQHARARTHVSPINAPPMLLCNGTVSSAWFNQSIRIFDKFLCEFVWFMHVSEQCNFSKASVWQRVGFGASLGFSVWSPPPAISSKWPGTRGTWRSGRVALQSLEIAIDRTTHDDAPAADPEHCSLVQRPGIFEDLWKFPRIKTPMSKWFRHVSNVWKTMWAKNKKIQKEQRSAFGCRSHCRVYVEVEIVVEMASFCLTGSSPHDAQPSHSSSSLSSWCDGDGGEVSRASSLVQIHISQSFLTSEGFQPQTLTDQICQSCLMETFHISSFSETFVKKNREAFVPPLCGHRRQRTCHPPQVSVLSAQLSKEKSTSVKSVINQWTKAGKEGRIWKKKGMIFRTTCQGRRMCTLKQSQLQLGQPSFGNEEDSRMRTMIKRRMRMKMRTRMTTPDPARLEPLRAKTPPKKDWFNHRNTPPKILWLNLRNQLFASSPQYVCKSRANSRWENPAFVNMWNLELAVQRRHPMHLESSQKNRLVQAQSWIGIDALGTTNIFEVHAIQPQKFQGRVVCRQCRLQGRVACYDFSHGLLTRKPCGLNQQSRQSSFRSVPLTLICSSVEPTTKTTSQKQQNQRFGN